MGGALSGGKGGGSGQKKYFGSFALMVCMGPVSTLYTIKNGDTAIFTGPILSTGADSDGKTTITTTIGTVDFYWGSSSQNPNALLSSLVVDMGSGPISAPCPAYRNCCYAVFHDASFGNQVAPPTLQFEVVVPTSGLTLGSHIMTDDSIAPEVVYEYLTSALIGHGIDPSNIDSASFTAAATTIISEGLGVSPNIDKSEDSRALLGRILSHIDGYLYFHHGKIKLALIRHTDTTSVPSLSEADLLDEPEPSNALFAETWNETKVSYQDRDSLWADRVESYSDLANLAIVGNPVEKEMAFPYLTWQGPAKLVAKLQGSKGGVPPVTWTLQLKPTWRTLEPGSLFKLSFAKLGVSNRVLRVTEIKRGQPSKPAVQVTALEEQTRDLTHDYIPPTDDISVPAILDDSGGDEFSLTSTTPRLSTLPSELKGTSLDGFLVAYNKPDSTTSSVKVWWTWDPGQQAYVQIATGTSFPAKAQLLAWWNVRGNWMLRVQCDSALDLARLQALAENTVDFGCVVGQRDYATANRSIDQHQVMALALSRVGAGKFDLLGGNWVDIEMKGTAYGTPDLLLETAIADGTYPTLHCYFGRKSDFVIYPSSLTYFERNAGNAPVNPDSSSADTDWKRYIKATVTNWKGEQALADVTAVYLDRNDLTMCPGGTYSRDWGGRAATAYEVCDISWLSQALQAPDSNYTHVADLDQMLGNILAGTASTDDALLGEHIDKVLGKMVTTENTYYNE